MDKHKTKQCGKYDVVPTERLHPHPRNPRNHGEAVRAIEKSIRQFGFVEPIVARKKDGCIIAGHARLKAAKACGYKEVPVIWCDLKDVDALAYMIASNKTGELAEWDQVTLDAVVAAIAEESAEALSATGLSPEEIDGMLGGALEEPTTIRLKPVKTAQVLITIPVSHYPILAPYIDDIANNVPAAEIDIGKNYS